MSELKELFDSLISEGKNKDEIIIALCQEGDLSITKAMAAYNKLAQEAGLVPSPKERKNRVMKMLDEYGEKLADLETRKEVVQLLKEEFDVSSATLNAYIKEYCAEHGIELPSAHRNDSGEVDNFIRENVENGVPKAEIVQGLIEKFGYTENSAASIFSIRTRAMDIASGLSRNRVDLTRAVEIIIENEEKMNRADLASLLAAELGCSASTTYALLGYLNFAKEYHKQLSEVAEEA